MGTILMMSGRINWIRGFTTLTFWKGDTKLQRATTPLSAKSLATSATRRIFSSRSSFEKPRFLFRPDLTLSPSRAQAGIPWVTRKASSSKEIDVFPAPDRPRIKTRPYNAQSQNYAELNLHMYVHLQDPESNLKREIRLPVNQTVQPRNPRRCPRIFPRVSRDT